MQSVLGIVQLDLLEQRLKIEIEMQFCIEKLSVIKSLIIQNLQNIYIMHIIGCTLD